MNCGQNMTNVAENNRRAVFRYLITHPVTTRAEIAKSIGLKQATITNIINSFLEMKIVNETQFVRGEKGRRSIGVSLDFSKFKMIAILITKLRVQVVVQDLGLHVYDQKTIQLTDGQTARELLNIVTERVDQILACNSKEEICAIGVTVPGPFLRKEARIPMMSWMPGWQDISLKKELTERFDLPVYIEHEANAAALGEWRFGEVTERDNTLMYINAGKGIGSGLIIDGKIYHGNTGIAGELGHVSISFDGEVCECGNRGCLEKYCSTNAFKSLIRQKLERGEASCLTGDSTLEEMLQASANGDPLASVAAEEIGDKLGCGLAVAINLFDPKEIIVSGELTKAGSPFFQSVVASVQKRILPFVFNHLIIRVSELNREACRLGICELTAAALIDFGKIFKGVDDLSSVSPKSEENTVL